jgi:hypothetical protein
LPIRDLRKRGSEAPIADNSIQGESENSSEADSEKNNSRKKSQKQERGTTTPTKLRKRGQKGSF